jgi:glycosyltransferase involved in cell wall biosynthesis
MRVLFLTNIPTPYRVDFFNELGNYCDLTVLYERKNADDREKSWTDNNSINYKSHFLGGKKIGNDTALSVEIVKWIKKGMFDFYVIGGYSTPTAMLAINLLKLKHIPFFINADGGLIKDDSFFMKLLKTYLIKSAKWYLSSSDNTSKYLEFYGAPKDKIFKYPFTSINKKEVLENCVSQEEKQNIKKSLGLKNNKIVISVGQLIERKGFDILIEAWSKINEDACLCIIGSGNKKDQLEKKIQNLGLENIRLIDFKKKEELFLYYKSADIFVLPTKEDIWGLVVNEAMACGLPIVSTVKCVAALELVEVNVNGFLTDVDDIDNISLKLQWLLENDTERQEFGNKSLEKASKYTIEAMAYEHYKIFENIK